jgi:hypothetical protein
MRLQCVKRKLRQFRFVARQALQGGHFFAIADARLADGLGQDSDVLFVSTTVNGERMAIFSTVRIGLIGPLPAGLLLIGWIIGGIMMGKRVHHQSARPGAINCGLSLLPRRVSRGGAAPV